MDVTLDDRVLDLHLLGERQVAIAERFGISQQRVSQILSQAKVKLRSDLNRDYEDHLAEMLALLKRILRATEVGLEAGDPKSIEAATRLAERLSRLLGLDHSDRMNERMVQVEETKQQILVQAMATVFNHLGLVGPERDEAFNVLQRELASRELV